MNYHYYKIPLQLFEDLANGKITNKMFVVLVWLYRRADFYTGVVKQVSARRILGDLWADDREDGRPTERTIQELLYRLRECRYFTSHHVQGVRGSYCITLNNFVAVKRNDGETTAIALLRPTETLDWHELPKKRRGDSQLEVCADASDEISGDGSGDASAYRELSSFSGISELSRIEVERIEPNDSAPPDSDPTEMGAYGAGKALGVGVEVPATSTASSLVVPVHPEALASLPPSNAAPPSPLNLSDEDTAFLATWFPRYSPMQETAAQLARVRAELGRGSDRLTAYIQWLRTHRKEQLRCNVFSKFVQASLEPTNPESGAVAQFEQHTSLNCPVCKGLEIWLDKEPKPKPRKKRYDPNDMSTHPMNQPEHRIDDNKMMKLMQERLDAELADGSIETNGTYGGSADRTPQRSDFKTKDEWIAAVRKDVFEKVEDESKPDANLCDCGSGKRLFDCDCCYDAEHPKPEPKPITTRLSGPAGRALAQKRKVSRKAFEVEEDEL